MCKQIPQNYKIIVDIAIYLCYNIYIIKEKRNKGENYGYRNINAGKYREGKNLQ